MEWMKLEIVKTLRQIGNIFLQKKKGRIWITQFASKEKVIVYRYDTENVSFWEGVGGRYWISILSRGGKIFYNIWKILYKNRM